MTSLKSRKVKIACNVFLIGIGVFGIMIFSSFIYGPYDARKEVARNGSGYYYVVSHGVNYDSSGDVIAEVDFELHKAKVEVVTVIDESGVKRSKIVSVSLPFHADLILRADSHDLNFQDLLELRASVGPGHIVQVSIKEPEQWIHRAKAVNYYLVKKAPLS